MGSLLHYLGLQAKIRTGLTASVVGCGIAAVAAGIVSLVLFLLTAFLWLADRYNSIAAALILATCFLFVCAVTFILCLMSRNRAVRGARREAAVLASTRWGHPIYLAMATQVARGIGVRRVVPLVAAGILAAALAREWSGRDPADGGAGKARGSADEEREAA